MEKQADMQAQIKRAKSKKAVVALVVSDAKILLGT